MWSTTSAPQLETHYTPEPRSQIRLLGTPLSYCSRGNSTRYGKIRSMVCMAGYRLNARHLSRSADDLANNFGSSTEFVGKKTPIISEIRWKNDRVSLA
jgi:hypothetical protein